MMLGLQAQVARTSGKNKWQEEECKFILTLLSCGEQEWNLLVIS